MNIGPCSDPKWVYDSPIHSDVEAKLRSFLVELVNADKIIGIQVCAYKDGQVIIDTAAGVLGKDDPRPVQPDSLFPAFSTTKGVTAGMVHWLADKGKLKLDENVANIWPGFGINGKDQIKVNHVLNHTSGLHNALAGVEDDPTLICDYDECLKRIAMSTPETEPGSEQIYHCLSSGWLCGGIIEHASGKKFQEVLEEAFVRPLNVEGEFYIGIPPGVESRLATVTVKNPNELHETSPFLPSSYTVNMISSFIEISNILNFRRAIVPAGNGHFSARALARYYAALVDGGVIPPNHPSSYHPLGNPTTPKSDEIGTKLFTGPKEKIHDAFLGTGDFKDLIISNGLVGLGFGRIYGTDRSVMGFGLSGLGGSTGYGDIKNRFAISVTVNKLSTVDLTSEIIRFVCSELVLPVPIYYGKPVIN